MKKIKNNAGISMGSFTILFIYLAGPEGQNLNEPLFAGS
jgi:hypothetical protein